ncbi:MAG TPA: RNA polymerase sigma-70 factor [Chloroflexota bacterium]|nr:RNA polymerase sigma-70 factor [Chloroflexota bacterium]
MNGSAEQHAATFQQYHALLFSIAYRMLGSVAEAEDVLQDAYLRFQTAKLSEVESPKAYLSTIVTRLCLNVLESARARRESYVGTWLPEPVLTTADAGALSDEESISLAFLKLLENLTPLERAVFLLHEVFDYDYADVARMLDRSEAACRKLFSRAKQYLSENRPRFAASPAEHRRILEQFIQAASAGDLQGLTELLVDDVTFWADGGGKVRGAALRPVHGRAAVARFVLSVTERFLPPNARPAIGDVNGKPTLLIRQADGTPALVVSVGVERGHITDIWAVANPDKLRGVA